jgi:hypothetical protein
MGIQVTRRKLAEARFFFDHLNNITRTAQTRPRPDWEVFGYYLSAFISAARSVPWVCQAENKTLYDRARPLWEESLTDADRELLKSMRERRNAEVKQTGVEVQQDMDLIPITEVRQRGAGMPPHLAIAWLGDDFAPLPQIATMAPKFIDSGQPQDLVTTCRRYVELLEKLIQICEQICAEGAGARGERVPNRP